MSKEKKEVSKYKYPSRFGSHSSMVASEKVADMPGMIVLTDEYGDYETLVSRLDTGLADPNRFAVSRLHKLFDKKAEEV